MLRIDSEECTIEQPCKFKYEKHAYWIETFDNELECSNCGKYAALNMYGMHMVQDEYCRHCGAKMDLGKL